MKKAQGISMNVIIIAAIALLVLVILSVLVLRAGGNVNQGSGCVGVGGTCVKGDSSVCSNQNLRFDPAHGCGEDGVVCCIDI